MPVNATAVARSVGRRPKSAKARKRDRSCAWRRDVTLRHVSAISVTLHSGGLIASHLVMEHRVLNGGAAAGRVTLAKDFRKVAV